MAPLHPVVQDAAHPLDTTPVVLLTVVKQFWKDNIDKTNEFYILLYLIICLDHSFFFKNMSYSGVLHIHIFHNKAGGFSN